MWNVKGLLTRCLGLRSTAAQYSEGENSQQKIEQEQVLFQKKKDLLTSGTYSTSLS